MFKGIVNIRSRRGIKDIRVISKVSRITSKERKSRGEKKIQIFQLETPSKQSNQTLPHTPAQYQYYSLRLGN